MRRVGRRDQILDAADRVVARAGSSASINAIAAEAGIAKPIVYRHFGDKDGLYRALAERHTEALLREIRGALGTSTDLRVRTAAAIDTFLRMIDAHPHVYQFLTVRSQEPGVIHTLDVFTRRLGDELAESIGAELGIGTADDPVTQTWAHGIVGLIRNTADVWLERRHVTREELVAQLVTLLWYGFARPPGPPLPPRPP